MPRRKRRFESLEDRRLLAALVGPMTPAQSPVGNVAEFAPASALASAASADKTFADSAGDADSQPDGDPSNDSSEYASAASQGATPSSTGTTAASSYDYGSSSYNNSSYEYSSSSTDPYSSKTPSTPHTTTQPPTASNPALSGEEATGGLINVASTATSAFSLSTDGPGPSATNSPPAARSSPASIVSEQDAGDVTGETQGPDPSVAAELSAPVALASSPSDFDHLTDRPQIEDLVGHADNLAPAAEIRNGAPIVGSSAVDVAAIEKGIDEVFDRIERLGDDLVGRAGATRLAEWVVIAGGACAAFEYVRIRVREAATWQTVGPWPVAPEPRLRRRWFRGRRNS
ncbi:MAG TPA: hypothetical protein VG826_24235 [Pirellulales bacterium]|nr:hypothetical protein [Pirellulales bacterium]